MVKATLGELMKLVDMLNEDPVQFHEYMEDIKMVRRMLRTTEKCKLECETRCE